MNVKAAWLSLTGLSKEGTGVISGIEIATSNRPSPG